jgi:cytochrome c oxidase cbb3-type subunit 2
MYDHPFQWGSKRTGPDLARVGGRYSDVWQVEHLRHPQALVPESIMPRYGFLADTELDLNLIQADLQANALVGVPYSQEAILNARADLVAQASPDGDSSAFTSRYANARVADFDGNPARITEMDALVAYLQMLGTLVDFTQYDAKSNYR